MKQLKLAAAGALALAAAGCAAPLAGHSPSMDALQALRNGGTAPMRTGDFGLAPGKPDGMDTGIGCRASQLTSPDDGRLSHYLGKALETNLRAAGKLDANATLVVSGLLTRSDLDCGIGTGTGALAARFTLARGGQTVFDKELSVSDTWEGSFVGAVAIPDAINHYTALYDKLVVALVSDPDFKAAAKAQ